MYAPSCHLIDLSTQPRICLVCSSVPQISHSLRSPAKRMHSLSPLLNHHDAWQAPYSLQAYL